MSAAHCTHACRQGRPCPEIKHGCDKLGLCERECMLLFELPEGCHPDSETLPPAKFPFAPGIIDGADNIRPVTVRSVIFELVCLAAGIGIVAFVSGYVATKLGWVL